MTVQYCQPYSNILQEGMVRKKVGQSILELGYHCPSEYGDEKHLPMIVMNGLLVDLLTLNYLQMSVKMLDWLILFQVSSICLVDS